jgi:hypothetical protein
VEEAATKFVAGAFAAGLDDAVIRMRGLPFSATPQDIVRVWQRFKAAH